jgi:hypothetical protein
MLQKQRACRYEAQEREEEALRNAFLAANGGCPGWDREVEVKIGIREDDSLSRLKLIKERSLPRTELTDIESATHRSILTSRLSAVVSARGSRQSRRPRPETAAPCSHREDRSSRSWTKPGVARAGGRG